MQGWTIRRFNYDLQKRDWHLTKDTRVYGYDDIQNTLKTLEK